MKQFLLLCLACILVFLAGCGAGALYDYLNGFPIPYFS